MQGLGTDDTYSLKDEFAEVAPAPAILLEGAYSASPFLRDLVDLAVIVDVPTKVRHARLVAREQGGGDFLAGWHAVWDAVESHYFASVCPPRSFDLVIQN